MDPPETTRSRSKWAAILDELRPHPGKWARVAVNTRNSSYASMINSGRLGGSKPGEFEAVSRRSTEGEEYDIYARYVGLEA
jgi:hypothetical protein